MTDHTTLALMATAVITLTALMIATAASYLARRDHVTYPQAISQGARAFATALTLAAALAIALHSLAH